jgi:serine/threonine protein kinase
MTPERFRQIEELYHAALEDRAVLDGADPELRSEVESLLAQQVSLPELGSASTATQVAVGALLGPYRIEAQIGEGGMGTVYRALDTKLNRPVAIKLLSDQLADAAARRRFQREAQTASSLNHPHILTVHDAGEIEGRQYLVTEYIDGGTLKDWAKTEKRAWRQVVELLTGVADGLATAHTAGILHRDIKPANILITKSGYAKLADFGLAKLVEEFVPDGPTQTLTEKRTRAGMVIGTIAYMSPEQASGKPLDARSDIFSFGVVLYSMLAGRRPFEGATDLETLQTIIHGTSAPLGDEIPVALRSVVEKALEKDPADRYQSMREMVVDLRRLTRQSGQSAVVPSTEPVAATATRQRRRRWWIAAALATVALGAGGWWTFRSKPPTLIDGSTPSANREANDQYNLAFNVINSQNDVPRAKQIFGRALELDPHFASAHLQHASMIVVELFNGFSNDVNGIYQAEEELHQAEHSLPGSDGLLLSTQTAIYLAEGRLDRIPAARLEEHARKGGSPLTFLVIIRLLQGQTQEPRAMLQEWIERHPLDSTQRMFLGEILRTQGDRPGAIKALELVTEQAIHPTAAWILTMSYLDDGKPEKARALLEGMRPVFEKNYMWRHAWAILLATEGKRTEAHQAMDEETLKYARLTWLVTSATADFYALQGDPSKAIEWLQLGIARGDERVSYYRRNPRLATLRGDPRFQSLLKSVEARGK